MPDNTLPDSNKDSFEESLNRVTEELKKMNFDTAGPLSFLGRTGKHNAGLLKTNILIKDAIQNNTDVSAEAAVAFEKLEEFSKAGIKADAEGSAALLDELKKLEKVIDITVDDDSEKGKLKTLTEQVRVDVKSNASVIQRFSKNLGESLPELAGVVASLTNSPMAGVVTNWAVKGGKKLLFGDRKNQSSATADDLLGSVERAYQSKYAKNENAGFERSYTSETDNGFFDGSGSGVDAAQFDDKQGLAAVFRDNLKDSTEAIVEAIHSLKSDLDRNKKTPEAKKDEIDRQQKLINQLRALSGTKKQPGRGLVPAAGGLLSAVVGGGGGLTTGAAGAAGAGGGMGVYGTLRWLMRKIKGGGKAGLKGAERGAEEAAEKAGTKAIEKGLFRGLLHSKLGKALGLALLIGGVGKLALGSGGGKATPKATPERGRDASGAELAAAGVSAAAARVGVTGAAAGLAGKFASREGAKTVGKWATKEGGKSLLKKIPGLSILAGIGFALDRVAKGDWVGGAMELTSGATGTVPLYGTMASVGIDAAAAVHETKYDDKNPAKAKKSISDISWGSGIMGLFEKSIKQMITVGAGVSGKLTSDPIIMDGTESPRRMKMIRSQQSNGFFGSTPAYNKNKGVYVRPAMGANFSGMVGGTRVTNFSGTTAMKRTKTSTNNALLDAIAKGESGSAGYDASWTGSNIKPSKPLSQMTLGEVQNWQKKTLNDQKARGIPQSRRSSAAGRYQFISGTLSRQMAATGLKSSDKFNQENQDRLAMSLINQGPNGLHALKAGTTTENRFNDYIASQWASVKNSKGIGVYDQSGFNRSSTSGTSILNAIKSKGPNNFQSTKQNGRESVAVVMDTQERELRHAQMKTQPVVINSGNTPAGNNSESGNTQLNGGTLSPHPDNPDWTSIHLYTPRYNMGA